MRSPYGEIMRRLVREIVALTPLWGDYGEGQSLLYGELFSQRVRKAFNEAQDIAFAQHFAMTKSADVVNELQQWRITSAELLSLREEAIVGNLKMVEKWAENTAKRGMSETEIARRATSNAIGSGTRLAANGGRHATEWLAELDPTCQGYRRMTQPGACNFCVTVSDNIYNSPQTAMQSGFGEHYSERRRINRSGSRAMPKGAPYHFHCGCYPVPIF